MEANLSDSQSSEIQLTSSPAAASVLRVEWPEDFEVEEAEVVDWN